jgi:hypothetical protein
MGSEAKKWFSAAPAFDPAEGTTVIEPPGTETGYWAGALSAVYDDSAGEFYLYYRVRRPIGKGRGWQCHVARSTDGSHFSTVWTATKEQFGTESFEGGALVRAPDGGFRLYSSYLDAADRRWKIALLEAATPGEFDPGSRKVVLSGEDAGSEGVKDPCVAIVDGRYYMFVNYAPRWLIPPGVTEAELHDAGNVFATKYGGSSGLATSADGVHFEWKGDVLRPGGHWDRLLTRVDTVVHRPPLFTVFYSGRGSVEETYEDRTGIAVSLDLEMLHKISDERPVLASPHSSGALRYMDAVPVGNEMFYYYEYARPDGAHEIRLSKTR